MDNDDGPIGKRTGRTINDSCDECGGDGPCEVFIVGVTPEGMPDYWALCDDCVIIWVLDKLGIGE